MKLPFFLNAAGVIAALLVFGLGGAAQAQERFTVSQDGQTVTDSSNKLTWRRCLEGMTWDGKACTGKARKFTFAAAKKYAAEQNGGAGKGWRVPTIAELATLLDKTQKKSPKIDKTAFPGTPSSMVWATRPESTDNLNAWILNFSNGHKYGNAGSKEPTLRLVNAAGN